MAGFHLSTLLLLSLATSYAVAFSYSSYIALVTVRCNGETDRCLGAVVADNHVVTAARCFNKCSNPTVRVYTRLGRSSRNRLTLGGRMRRTEVTVHPDYNSSSNLHDIALIKIDCLTSDIVKLQPVDRCSLFSDATEYGFCDLSNSRTLVEYNVTRARKRSCTREYTGAFSSSQMLCFSKPQCSDNAVGLAVRDNRLFGLSLFGLECPSDGEEPHNNFVSLDICRYSKWIQDQISKEGDECKESATTATTTPTTVPTTAAPPTTTSPPPTTTTTDSDSPTPNSFIVGCPRLVALAHGSIKYILNVATFTCDAGYHRRGSPTSACLFGVWTPKPPTCEPILCPTDLKNITNGQVRLTGNTVGSAAIYTCSPGYTLGGFAERRCKEDGVWEGTPPTCHLTKRLLCKHPGTIRCATVALHGGLIDGSTVTYTPDANSQLIGETTLTCKNGQWSAPVPKCRVLCSTDFPLENGRYELEFSEDSIDYKMSITCNRGYTGNNLRDEYTCSDGNWSPTPRSAQCVATCPTINLGNTGQMNMVNAGAIRYAVVSCHNNYRLVGRPVTLCINGVWQGVTPSCRPL